jgi:hypothetical protein
MKSPQTELHSSAWIAFTDASFFAAIGMGGRRHLLRAGRRLDQSLPGDGNRPFCCNPA